MNPLLERIALLHAEVNDLALALVGEPLALEEHAIAREMLVAVTEDIRLAMGDLSEILIQGTENNAAFTTEVGQFKNQSESKRTDWDPDLMLEALPRALVVHAGIRPEPAKRIARFVHLYGPFSPSWKVTGLKELGINPADHCYERKGRKVVFQGSRDSVRRKLAAMGGAPLQAGADLDRVKAQGGSEDE